MKKILCAALMLVVFASVAGAENQIETVKSGFMILYDSEWRLLNLNYLLYAAVNQEFDDAVGSMTFGTSGFQLATNRGGVAEKILDRVFARFQPEYELFFKNFYDKYYAILNTNPNKFSREKIKGLLEYEEVATIQDTIKQRALNNVAEDFKLRINKKISNPYYALIWLVLGLLILFFRRFIAETISNFKGNESRIKVMTVIAGLIIVAYGSFKISSGLFLTQGVIREIFASQTKKLYTSLLPEAYWSSIAPYIEKALIH